MLRAFRWLFIRKMNIIVCIKQVPITESLKLKAGESYSGVGLDRHINVFDGFAIEEALRIKDIYPDTTVSLLTMGDEDSRRALIEGLSLGADKAYLISDKAYAGYDAPSTSRVLANAIKHIEASLGEADIILTGNQSTDSGCGIIPMMLSEIMGLDIISSVVETSISEDLMSLDLKTRGSEAFSETSHGFPLILSMTKGTREVRMPTFKRIREANKAVITVIDSSIAGTFETNTKVLSVIKPGRNTKNSIVRSDDTEEGTAELLEMLDADSIFAI